MAHCLPAPAPPSFGALTGGAREEPSDPGAAASERDLTIGQEANAVVFDHVSLAFGDNVVLRDVSFSVRTAHMTILIGASGAGKSVVLKLILGLLKPDSGVIRVHGKRIDTMAEAQMMRVRDDIGMLFQENALFDSLTVADNVGYKLYEETDMPTDQVRRRVEEILGFVGLKEYVDRMPSELSGGQRRRVAIARAMAARPRLLLFDDPTSGLDPITAKTVDAEIIKLRDVQHVTSILVTHQLQDAFYIATHEASRQNGRFEIVAASERTSEQAQFIMLRNGRIYFGGSATDLRGSSDPYLKTFLSGWVPPLVA
jgi:phospholipid/cholesterol/gamma-HCH transport system ATP-binding protein